MRNFDNTYNSTNVYSKLKQSGLDNNINYIKNPEEPIKAERYPNNKPKSANPEKPTTIGRYAEKHIDKYIDPYLIIHMQVIVSTLSHSLFTKALAAIDTPNNNFNTLCTLCIASKETQVVIYNDGGQSKAWKNMHWFVEIALPSIFIRKYIYSSLNQYKDQKFLGSVPLFQRQICWCISKKTTYSRGTIQQSNINYICQ